MAGLRFLERLRQMQRDPERRVAAAPEEVLQSVTDYVGKILNTRKGSTVLDEDFGIPDFTSAGLAFSKEDMPRVEKEISAYNLSGYGETLSTDPGAEDLEYRIAYYDVKFPKDFPEGEEGIMDVFPAFTVTSEAGETTITLDNVKYDGLNDTVHISRPEQGYGFYAGSTYHGKLVFRMVKGCDAYRLVQLYDTEDGDTVKYVTLHLFRSDPIAIFAISTVFPSVISFPSLYVSLKFPS